MRKIFTLISIVLLKVAFIQISVLGQESNKNVFELLETNQSEVELTGKSNINNFDHWAYSEKKHAIVFYYAPMFQYGANSDRNAYQIHHDAGAMYRWFMVQNENFKLNFQGWVEQSSLLAGKTTKDFMKELQINSAHNASDTEDFSLTFENFFFEAFLFDSKWDITLGRFDPLFVTTFTDYCGWDKYNYFSKTVASDPVPDLGSGMGIYTEYHFSEQLSIGGLINDYQPKNDYLYIPDFGNTTYNYMAFARIKKPFAEEWVSNHNLIYYYTEPKNELDEARGFVYTGNQGLTANTILVLKASFGAGRIYKLNSAYALGITVKKPFHRAGDQFGVAAMVNEKSSDFEYGLDTYYKFFIRRWFTVSPNLQVYYGVNEKMNLIPGFRAFLAY